VTVQTPQLDRYKASTLRAYDGRLADCYDRSLPVRLLNLTVMDDFVMEVLGAGPESRSVLDVGCGTGRLLARLASAGIRDVAGSDLAPRMLEQARRRLSELGLDADLRCSDAEAHLPWLSDAFDVVVTTGVLHHLYRPAAALKEMERVLKGDGILITLDPCFFTPLREMFNLLLRVYPRDGDFRFYSPAQADRLLSRHGWRVERRERLNWWAYGLVARTES
jgi:SAM-dependent methyltransferase